MSFITPQDMDGFKSAVMGAAGKKVIMQFSADFCTVCKGIEGDLKKMAEDNADKIQFVYVDVTVLEDVAEMYEAADLPTFVAIDPSNPAATIKRVEGSKLDNIQNMVTEVAAM